MNVYLDNTIDSYRTFLRIKELPRYEIHGRIAFVPDEYAATLGLSLQAETPAEYVPRPGLFDYQPVIGTTPLRRGGADFTKEGD